MYNEACLNGSWADINDLFDRYGEEFVDKLSIRRNYDHDLQDYVADESPASMTRVQTLALEDAKAFIKERLSVFYRYIALVDSVCFGSIKQWHIKLAIETLKVGGDCRACGCLDSFNDYLLGQICEGDICLEKRSTFFSVSKPKFNCDIGGCDD